MKTRLRLSFLLTLMALANIQTFAADFEVDGLEYNVISYDEMTCETAGFTGSQESVEIPSTVENNGSTFTVIGIGDNTFYYSSLTSVTIPNSVTNIGQYAFYNCRSLTSVTIPNSVTHIGDDAFENCIALAEITIPSSVTSIGNYVFYGCLHLAEVTIPNSVTEIGYGTFRYCARLAEVTIPNSVTSIGFQFFYGCNSLTEVTIPNSVTLIDTYAFKGCTSLTEITIPNSVTEIGDGVFEDCTNLKEVTIGESVTLIGPSIGYGVFSGDENISAIYSLNPEPPICKYSGCFESNVYANATLYVPEGSVEAYREADVWKEFLNMQEMDTATGIENVTVSDKVKKSCIYNLNGMKVEDTVPGEIYIKNGKKFIAK